MFGKIAKKKHIKLLNVKHLDQKHKEITRQFRDFINNQDKFKDNLYNLRIFKALFFKI